MFSPLHIYLTELKKQQKKHQHQRRKNNLYVISLALFSLLCAPSSLAIHFFFVFFIETCDPSAGHAINHPVIYERMLCYCIREWRWKTPAGPGIEPVINRLVNMLIMPLIICSVSRWWKCWGRRIKQIDFFFLK